MNWLSILRRQIAAGCQALGRDRSGLALTEFAFTAPIVLSLGMLGTETAYYVITHMQVSQVAVQAADNISRIGEQSAVTAHRVQEREINEVFVGTEKLAGNIGLFQRGRVIISSLERNAQGGQTIRWQRCRGAKNHASSHGVEGVGATGTAFPGMGDTTPRLQAAANTAVMFVEVAYDYDSLTPFDIYDGRTITYTAAFNIRDNRALGVAPENTTNPPGPVARCNVFSANRPT